MPPRVENAKTPSPRPAETKFQLKGIKSRCPSGQDRDSSIRLWVNGRVLADINREEIRDSHGRIGVVGEFWEDKVSVSAFGDP